MIEITIRSATFPLNHTQLNKFREPLTLLLLLISSALYPKVDESHRKKPNKKRRACHHRIQNKHVHLDISLCAGISDGMPAAYRTCHKSHLPDHAASKAHPIICSQRKEFPEPPSAPVHPSGERKRCPSDIESPALRCLEELAFHPRCALRRCAGSLPGNK